MKVDSVLNTLLKDHPDKLQQILVKLQVNIQEMSKNDEMQEIEFYRYTIFVDSLLKHLDETDATYIYFKRTILYTLMNLIKDNSGNYKRCNLMACKYLKKIHNLLLTNNLNDLLLTIVSELISLSRGENQLASLCLDLLNYVMSKNTLRFADIIHLLDPFPEDAKFTNLAQIYNELKYKQGQYTLKSEISNFIEVSNLIKDVNSREEGLKHLRNQLCVRRDEIQDLYAELDDKKHEIIDHEESIVHQLIRVLVKYARSNNNNVSN